MKAARKTWPPSSIAGYIEQEILPELPGIAVRLEIELKVNFGDALTLVTEAYTDLLQDSYEPAFVAGFTNELAFLRAFEERCRNFR